MREICKSGSVGARGRQRPWATRRRMRAGLDRADLYRRAAGSAAELTTALRIARARGYVSAGDIATVEQLLDRVRAMLWRLTH